MFVLHNMQELTRQGEELLAFHVLCSTVFC